MADSYRFALKRKWTAVITHQETTLLHIAELHDIYITAHPDIAEKIMSIFQTQDAIKTAIERLNETI